MPETHDPKRILVAGNDARRREDLIRQLAMHRCFDLAEAQYGALVLSVLDEGPVDLVLLDAHLPDMDGRELCRLMRQRGICAPVILMGEETDGDPDVILGLHAGADDYLSRPFTFSVLLARVRAQLRRSGTALAWPG